jgi:hypothetical protein
MTSSIPSLWSLDHLTPYVSVLVEDLIADRLDPLLIPIPVQTDLTPWLDELEGDVFNEANCKTKKARAKVRCDRGGFRIVRNLADDNVSLIAQWLRAVSRLGATDRSLERLLTEFQAYEPILPRHASETVQ